MNSNLTIVIISHNSNLKYCNKIINISNDKQAKNHSIIKKKIHRN